MNRQALSFTLLAALAACSSITGQDCDICIYHAEIQGTVLDGNDGPLPGAEVQVWPLVSDPGQQDASCGTRIAELGGRVARDTTDSTGEFSLRLQTDNLTPTPCIEVTVVPQDGSVLEASVDTVAVTWSRGAEDPPITHVSVDLE